MALSFLLQRHGYPSVSVLVADATIPLAGCFIAYTSFLFVLYILLYNTTPCQEVFLLFCHFFSKIYQFSGADTCIIAEMAAAGQITLPFAQSLSKGQTNGNLV